MRQHIVHSCVWLVLDVKLEISWLQQGLRGVSRWRTASCRTPHSNNRLIIELNSTNWNAGPTAYTTVMHSPPRTCAFTTILLWNRGHTSAANMLFSGYWAKRLYGRKKVKCTLRTRGQKYDLSSLRSWRKCILLRHKKASSCLSIQRAAAVLLPSAHTCTNLQKYMSGNTVCLTP